MMNKDVINVENVYKSYGSLQAVRGLSFSVESSTCFALLGPNGAGKTTMMKMIYGKCVRDLDQKSRVDVFSKDPLKQELAIKYVSGVVPQEDNIDLELNVKENLEIYSKFYWISRQEADSRINRLLDFMELSDKKDVKIRELSGGMKRRLLIVRALLNNPRLLILDEPTTGLDPQVRHLIWNKIRQLKKEGTTVLITTHYMEEAYNLADKILILHEGKKVVEGNPRTLINEHMHEYVLETSERDIDSYVSGLDDGIVLESDDLHDIHLFYSNDHIYLKRITERFNPGSYNIRQTNLEDLFLRITGKKLHEGQ